MNVRWPVHAAVLGLLLALLSARSVRAQGYECFLRGQDQGESTNATHRNWSDVTAWRNEMIPSSGYSDLYITKPLDSSSPGLSLMVGRGTSFHGNVQFDCLLRGTTNLIYRIDLDNVTALGIRIWTEKPNTDPRPLEEIQLRYTRATWTYNKYDPVSGAFVRSYTATWP
ncbi:MAG: type VI secretion system tube protein Hcp [bacterium]